MMWRRLQAASTPEIFISALAEGVEVSQRGWELLHLVLCGCVTARWVLQSPHKPGRYTWKEEGSERAFGSSRALEQTQEAALCWKSDARGKNWVSDVQMILPCSGTGGSKASCAFCPGGSDAAEECAAAESSLQVIKPFHFQNRDLLFSAIGGL